MDAHLFDRPDVGVFVEVGVGDARPPVTTALWGAARWNDPAARWSGLEPAWLDITCDVHRLQSQRGRARAADRWVVGQASFTVDNRDGRYTSPPGTFSVLPFIPGRAIRWGITHPTLGRVVRWRGYLDDVDPLYTPQARQDVVTMVAVDALGEVGRAKHASETPIAPGTTSAGVVAVLDAQAWPAQRRRVAASSVRVLPFPINGQAADLLGVLADTEGGAVYGDTDGAVVSRLRDWQVYLPGTPPAATVGDLPGDVCPNEWDTIFRRADLTTRVIVGNQGDDPGDYVVVDDADGIVRYGVEPFERVDLLAADRAQLTTLAARHLATRAPTNTARVAAVTLDAAHPAALDVMAGADPGAPTRWRCRHHDTAGVAVFDIDCFVTAVVDQVAAGNRGARWALNAALDPSAPYAAVGGRWGGAGWDRAVWASPIAATLGDLLAALERSAA